MTKGGVTFFTKSRAIAFATKGDRIRVNAVHPGVKDTPTGQKVMNVFADKSGMKGDD